MYLLLTTLSVILCTTTAFPRSGTSNSRMTPEQRTICELLDYFMCGRDLCRNTYCYYYPEAVCRIVPLQCGCRSAWYTSYGEVDCNVPRPPRRRLTPFQMYLQDQLRRSTGLGGTTSTASINRVPTTGGRNLLINPQPMNPQPMNPQPVPMVPGPVVVDPRPVVPISMDPNPSSTVCPNGVLLVECQHNPCLDAPDMPGTTCRPNYCGGCTADIYRNGMKEYCADCEFPHLIIRSSVVRNDPNAYVNTFRNVHTDAPPTPTNGAPWTEAGPRIPLTELYVQDASPTSFSKISGSSNTASSVLDLQSNIGSVSHIGQPQIPNAGISDAGSSILALQGNIGSVSHLSSPSQQSGAVDQGSSILNMQSNIASVSSVLSNNPINSQVSNPMTAVNDLSKTMPTIGGRRYLVSMKPGYVVDPNAICPNGKRQAKCYSDPCFGRTCEMYPSAICRPSPCGNCEAKWYMNGTEVDCERCNGTTWVTSCPLNPCSLYSCPAYPHAECRMTKCGACNDLWFDDGRQVKCNVDWPECTAKENQACKESCPRDHCPTDYEALCRVKGCGASCQLEYYKIVGDFFVPVPCQLLGTWKQI